ncbi:MAG: hypothetical protein RIS47_1915 [Bacteroidota bacterium]
MPLHEQFCDTVDFADANNLFRYFLEAPFLGCFIRVELVPIRGVKTLHGRRPTGSFALRTYGVTNGAADRTSPDSSGSPQRRGEASASRCHVFEIQMFPVDFVPEREDYKRIAGSSLYKYCWATASYLYFFSFLFRLFFLTKG